MRLSGYFTILKKAQNEKLYYKGKVLLNLIVFAVRIILLFTIYSAVYRITNKTEVGGLSLESAVWSIGIYFILLGIQTRHVAKKMSLDIRSGDIELKICKPYNYIFYNIFNHIGSTFSDFIYLLLIAIPYLIFVVGFPDVYASPFVAVQATILFLFGIILSYLIGILVGLTAFWIEDNLPIYWIVDKGLMIFGGSYFPVAFFSPSLRLVAESLPFGAQTLVNQVVYPDFNSNFIRFVITQIIWIIILSLCVVAVYKQGLKHLSVNGG